MKQLVEIDFADQYAMSGKMSKVRMNITLEVDEGLTPKELNDLLANELVEICASGCGSDSTFISDAAVANVLEVIEDSLSSRLNDTECMNDQDEIVNDGSCNCVDRLFSGVCLTP